MRKLHRSIIMLAALAFLGSPVLSAQTHAVKAKGKVRVEVGGDIVKQVLNMGLDTQGHSLTVQLTFTDDKQNVLAKKEIPVATSAVKVLMARGFSSDYSVDLKVNKNAKAINVDANVCGNIGFDSKKCVKVNKSAKVKNLFGFDKKSVDLGTVKVSL